MVIVAAVDRSERASRVLEEAERLAEGFGDAVHVLHVLKRSEAIELEESSVSSGEGLSVDELRATADDAAAEVVASCDPAGDVTAVGRIGDPAAEIVRYARETDARYVVVSPHRTSRTGKVLFGSVAQSVLLNADCPVVSTIAPEDTT